MLNRTLPGSRFHAGAVDVGVDEAHDADEAAKDGRRDQQYDPRGKLGHRAGVVHGGFGEDVQRVNTTNVCLISIEIENRQIISCCLATNLIWYVIRRHIISRFRFKYRFRNQLFIFKSQRFSFIRFHYHILLLLLFQEISDLMFQVENGHSLSTCNIVSSSRKVMYPLKSLCCVCTCPCRCSVCLYSSRDRKE